MVTDTSKSLRFQKTQMFSQMIDQKEHKNNRYKFEPATWCYKHHSIVLEPELALHRCTTAGNTLSLTSGSEFDGEVEPIKVWIRGALQPTE